MKVKVAKPMYSMSPKLSEVEDPDYDMALSPFEVGYGHVKIWLCIHIKGGLDQFIDLTDLTSTNKVI